MHKLIVIPARMSSQRLPGKPLKDIAGKTLIERVYGQAMQAKGVNRVVVATDSPEILNACKTFGAEVIETSPECLTGSDRVAEVVSQFQRQGQFYDLIANVQGDMPFIKPSIIEKAFFILEKSEASIGMATIVTPIHEEQEFRRDSVVKAVIGEDSRALYFSRAPIPYPRNAPIDNQPFGYKHIGLYVFRPEILLKMSTFKEAVAEKREGLEQLRMLANGVQIKAAIIERQEMEPQIEVDTLADLEAAVEIAKS
jgi:3-deoxy-manno-octulosonate cytidylyltransferase (CMP-KDO synthetase)